MSDEMEDDNPTTEQQTAAAAEPVPAQMPGFTILQILAWTNAEIEKCREKLEIEPSGRVVAFLQGKIPGCKFAINSIKDTFGLFDEPEHPADMGALSMEQILGAEIDMEELKKNELWGQFLSIIEARTEELKDFLLKRAKKSRELDEYQGEYQGMTHYLKVFAGITDQTNFWKNSLFKKDAGQDAETRSANEYPALPPPGLPDSEEDYPPAEEYEESGERPAEEAQGRDDLDIDVGSTGGDEPPDEE